ncbi:MAG TPA: diacylglycerol kinase family protein [Vineibacter sp.]|nr:diacylglycerol kinase family protein [Vineibacter sp.]
MRVSLIHNPAAGDEAHSRQELERLLRLHGHEIAHYASKKDDLSAVLADPGELVMVAGGDGTVGAVARKLINSDVPLAILPMGTANNIARAFGLQGEPADLIAGWANARPRSVDVGVASGPWGKSWFIEGVGLGLFATAMALLDEHDDHTGAKPDDPQAKLERDIVALSALAAKYPAIDIDGTIDDKPLSGRVLMVAAMNIASIGPNMDLAPNADPSDGRLDFALVREDRRADFVDYAVIRLRGGTATPPTEVHRGRRLHLSWSGDDAHIDDRAWRAHDPLPRPNADIEITVEPGALKVLLPRQKAE